jgi:hypothetical protein
MSRADGEMGERTKKRYHIPYGKKPSTVEYRTDATYEYLYYVHEFG